MTKLDALLTSESPLPEAKTTPYVLIIDEINRGNVSRIFGELITLIEPSKRAGNPEALSVTLPYSQKPFTVPDNVHLLGTMNTADRSLAGLDIALRRRFLFREMPPRAALLNDVDVAGVNIGQMLAVMNERIELLLDRDHLLGHAYFMPLAAEGGNKLETLARIFKNQVLPLLQEYFFEDWERIVWVLNDQRKADGLRFIRQRGAPLAQLFGAEQAGMLRDKRWEVNDDAFSNVASYAGILIADA
jgi:5-methylcytosine-specific restriction protein B